jgi:hypothetical protein
MAGGGLIMVYCSTNTPVPKGMQSGGLVFDTTYDDSLDDWSNSIYYAYP